MTDTDKQGPRIIDGWEAESLLRRIVNEEADANPAFVYQGPDGACVNLVKDDDGKFVGSCMVGRAFLKFGVKPTGNWEQGSFVSVLEKDEFKDANIMFTSEAKWVLMTAQQLQDGMMPWVQVLTAVENGLCNLSYFRRDVEKEIATEA